MSKTEEFLKAAFAGVGLLEGSVGGHLLASTTSGDHPLLQMACYFVQLVTIFH